MKSYTNDQVVRARKIFLMKVDHEKKAAIYLVN